MSEVAGSIEVLEALPIDDAAPPHRAWSGDQVTRDEPALLVTGAPLALRLVLPVGPAGPIAGTVTGTGVSLPLAGHSDGVTAVVSTGAAALADRIGVWDLQVELAGSRHPLRVFTVHDAPRRNTTHASRLPHAGKVHLEHACRWANGADQNVASGPRSIAHQVQNGVRHYVHPGPAYAGLPRPANYHRLPGHDAITDGARPRSPLYCPLPPWVSDERFARHYAENFGWMLLDNPTHPGGRCNQQASLLCEVLGTLGLVARVVHIERTASLRRGPDLAEAFQGFRTHAARDDWWDLHALAEVRLDDGGFHYYDCSFSRPDVGRGRLHGTREQMLGARKEDPRALLIHDWGPWFYALDRVEVPACLWPASGAERAAGPSLGER